MFSFTFFLFFFCIFVYIYYFKKKIMVLLSMELCLVSVIIFSLSFSFGSFGSSTFFSGLIFLTFMVIDSVFGLSLLIFSSRNSSSFSSFFYSF